jgi:hypothetical protein
MNEPTFDLIKNRVARLERECRHWRLAWFALVSVAAVVCIVGAGRQAQQPAGLNADRLVVRDLEAQRIVLKDEHGARWFYLESKDGIPQMGFEGHPGGKERGIYHIQLIVNRDGVPYMTMTGKDGEGGMLLGVNPAGEPHLSLSGKAGALTFRTAETGSPQLMLWDKDNRARIRVGLKPNGSAAVEVLDEKDAPPPQKNQ